MERWKIAVSLRVMQRERARERESEREREGTRDRKGALHEQDKQK